MPQAGEVISSKQLGMKGKSASYIWYECPQCHQYRWLRMSCMENTNFTGLCHKCNSKNQLPPEALNKGPTHSSWRGGRSRGGGKHTDYIVIWLAPDDFFFPMISQRNGYGGYVYEHRLVMAKHLHRCLLPWEIVHHINGVKDDNRLENLALYKIPAQHLPSTNLVREINKQQKIIIGLQNTVRELESKGGEHG